MLGDQRAWEVSHSLDGLGKKTAYLTDKTSVRVELERDVERWWTESTVIFPLPSAASG